MFTGERREGGKLRNEQSLTWPFLPMFIVSRLKLCHIFHPDGFLFGVGSLTAPDRLGLGRAAALGATGAAAPSGSGIVRVSIDGQVSNTRIIHPSVHVF